eukprot:SAG31_NODE_7288_length_1731_cov_1.142157_2_plen_194_part_00
MYRIACLQISQCLSSNAYQFDRHCLLACRYRRRSNMRCTRTATDLPLCTPCRCCRPVKLELECLTDHRISFVTSAVLELEQSSPEIVSQMVEYAKARIGLVISDDGSQVFSSSSGRVLWKPPEPDVTRVHSTNMLCYDSAAAFVVVGADLYICELINSFHGLRSVVARIKAAFASQIVPRHGAASCLRGYLHM